MSNPARAKGTQFENLVLSHLKEVFPEIERSSLKGINDYGDFFNVKGWMIEARNRKNWSLKEWIRQAYDRVSRQYGDQYAMPWAIVLKGDMRTRLNEPYVLISLRQFVKLLKGYYGVS